MSQYETECVLCSGDQLDDNNDKKGYYEEGYCEYHGSFVGDCLYCWDESDTSNDEGQEIHY
jgi:hypothetical protein